MTSCSSCLRGLVLRSPFELPEPLKVDRALTRCVPARCADARHEQQVKHPDDDPFARRRIREKGWDEVEDRRDPEVQGEQRVAGGRADAVAVRHDAMFPAAIGVFAFEKHLNVPADALDACVQREARFESDCQHKQGNQGRNRPGSQRGRRDRRVRPTQ